MNSTTRERHRQDVHRAYEIQSAAAVAGGSKGLLFGTGAAALAHYAWPLFKRQTPAFKAFLVSVCAVTGVVVAAEDALLKHEAQRRADEGALRRRARLELAREGMIGTETEIHKWKARNGLDTS